MSSTNTSEINLSYIIFTGKVPALKQIWILGDNFVDGTFDQYVKNIHRKKELYMKENFDITAFKTNEYDSHIRSMLGRIRNELTKAVNKSSNLPTIILFVLDDDIVRMTDIKSTTNASDYFSPVMNWLINEVQKIIAARKDQLPNKALNPQEPRIYWVEAPQHKNFENNLFRRKFNSSLQNVVDLQKDMRMMRLKKVWDYDDSSLFRNEHFTSDGLVKYWEAIDSSLHFNENIFQKTGSFTPKPAQSSKPNFRPGDRFKWHKNSDANYRFKLPQPPRHNNNY